MKKRQKRRFLALLTAVCLALSICVVPTAAEGKTADLERLGQELLAAKEEAERKRDALSRTEADAAGEKAALAEAERAARDELAEAEAALEAAGEDPENRAGLEERMEDAERRIDEIFEKMAAADARVRDAQNAAEEAEALAARKQDAYDAAREAAEEAERKRLEEEERRKKEEEEQRKQEEEQRQKEEERKKQEEEQRRKEEEERKRREEEEKKRQEEEEQRKQEEEQTRAEEEQRQEEKLQSLTPGSGDLSFSVSGVDFGSLEKGASGGLSRSVTLTNNSAGYAMALSAAGLPGFSVSGVPSSLEPGKSAVVRVTLSGAKAGEYEGSLQISGWYEDGGLKGSPRIFSLPVRARVTEKAASISASPSAKDLGRLTEGYGERDAGGKEFTVTVENKSADGVWLDGVKGAEHFTVAADGSGWLESGGRTGFTVVPKRGLKAGTYTDKIVFQTREGASAECRVTVEVEERGAPLAVNPGALDFGSAEEGYSALSAKTVTVKNNTDYEMRLEQPVSNSYDISLLDNVPVEAGASAVFAIRPRTGLPAGLYDGVIEVRSSGNETAKLQVKFTVNRPAGPTAFIDVEPGSTFAGDIAYVSRNGLMSGKGGGFFRPQEAVTRGQIVTILYRLEGQPAAGGAGFPDVAAGSYCEQAVKWAAAAGVTAGDQNGLFRPNDPVSREQLAAFLYRYNRYKGYESGKWADLGAFPDGGSVSAYAREALAWANGAGLINGTAAGLLNPSGGATRGQAAAILHRFCVSIGR